MPALRRGRWRFFQRLIHRTAADTLRGEREGREGERKESDKKITRGVEGGKKNQGE